MATAGVMPDPDQVIAEPIEDGEEIVERFAAGEISPEEFLLAAVFGPKK